jgi:hypothetical protein
MAAWMMPAAIIGSSLLGYISSMLFSAPFFNFFCRPYL